MSSQILRRKDWSIPKPGSPTRLLDTVSDVGQGGKGAFERKHTCCRHSMSHTSRRFQVAISDNGRLQCEATADVQGKPTTFRFDDAAQGMPLKDWVRSVMSHSLIPAS